MQFSVLPCLICGDKAIGRNFKVWSCTACKLFFQRNYKYQDNLICTQKLGGSGCQVNKFNRKKCRKCRMDKCLGAGMRKEYQLNQETVPKMVFEHQDQRSQLSITRTDSEPSSVSSYSSISDESIDELPDQLIHYSGDEYQDIDALEEIITINDMVNCSYNSVLDIPRPVTNNSDKCFNQQEQYKLMELTRVLNSLVTDTSRSTPIDNMSLDENLALGGKFFIEQKRTFGKIILVIGGVDSILANDIRHLMKHNWHSISILRSLLIYDHDNEMWQAPLDDTHYGEFNINNFRSYLGEAFSVYKNTWNCIVKECDQDSIIINLLTTIAFFNTNVPNIVNKHIIDVQRNMYMHLLHRYVYFKHQSRSIDKFGQLVNVLVYMNIMARLENRYLYEKNYQVFEPLYHPEASQRILNSKLNWNN